ncbi:MAG: hypothetical protein GY874_12505 [Desulfobacteraceae bacterium]|nr:hypothetical protein [Desulfobacteraceae bacterium]
MKTKMISMIILLIIIVSKSYAEEADTTILHKGKKGSFAISVITGKEMSTVFIKANDYKIKTYFDEPSARHESTKINGTTINGLFTSESFFEEYGRVVLFAQPGRNRISFGNIYKKYLADKTIIRKATEKESKDITTKEMFIIYHDFGSKAELSAWMMACLVSATSLK